MLVLTLAGGCAADPLIADVQALCREYVAGFGSEATGLVYHHRLNGPQGLAALESPEEIAAGRVRGKPMPYGYGSGIQDVALENGHLLFALCEAHEATGDEFFADLARRVFAGMRLVATVSPEPGFVPRGPHPDGKSYYRDSSLDQHTTFVYALWRYYHSSLATDEEKVFIAQELDEVARRLEEHEWGIFVEDGSARAHVGFSWLQSTCVGATTLLAVVGAVADVTDDAHWCDLHEQFSTERDGLRWRLLSDEPANEWAPFTLYSNQFAVALRVLAGVERGPGHQASVNAYRRAMAERMLATNVFDEACWRRLDWSGNWPDQTNQPDDWEEQQIAELLAPFGLSLQDPATVFDVYSRFDSERMAADDWRLVKVNGKLCFGIPTVAFHTALLSRDPDLARQSAEPVRSMVAQMLEHGHLYTHGENFNRAVALGLHLLTVEQ